MAPDRLSVVVAAVASPSASRAILARLAEGDATVSELAAPFPMSLPAVSRHLKVLERAGPISRSRSAQWRSSSLRPEPLREAMDRVEGHRRFWDTGFDRLDEHLRRTAQRRQQRDQRPDRPDTGGTEQ
ncbi:ArsR/SmtB family transcription factor [Umezawaea beigongshangensis]|uniref:ArsR/SmtB family transcription factor n=1 Tax=Umezawaea beigongshangensis TaxID=2780383 RepID=UPI0018F1AAFE|nr:metalloregulator ArsR/SmtB family transcription factor [Umezawaea beigongshangensis]